jgi:hypothetical protein
MATSKQVATGSHKRVLEDGDDKWDSSDEDDPNTKPDGLTGMYTTGMDPEKGPVQLTKRQVAAQKAAAVASRPPSSPVPEPVSVPERQPTPMSSDTEDQSEMTEDHKRMVAFGKKKQAVPRCLSVGTPIPPKDEGKPATRSRAVADPQTSGKKASRRTTDATGAKAPPPTK